MYQRTTDLAQVALAQLLLEHDHEGGGQEDDEAVTNVTKHDSEQEGESDDGEETRIDFLVSRDTIAVHDRLERLRELVRALKCRRLLAGSQLVQNGRYIRPRLLLRTYEVSRSQRRLAFRHTVA